MRRLIVSGLWPAIVAVLVASACAPVASPASAPAPAALPKAAPELSPEAAAWDKVMAAAKKEGKVTLYAYSWVGDLGLALSEAFRRKYSIRVEIITGRGAEFLERLKTERRTGRITGDIFEGSQTHTRNAKLEGLTVSVSDLPGLRLKEVWAVNPIALDPEGYLAGHTTNIYANFVNTNLVRPEQEPRSWADLLDPRWKGKMVVLDPNISTGLYYFEVQISRNILTTDFLHGLAGQQVRFARSSSDAGYLLARGEAAMYLQGTTSLMAPFAKEGAPVKAVGMKEGVPVGLMIMSAVNGGPNPNAARLFMDWLLSQEGQSIQGRAWGVASVRKDVPDFTPQSLQVPLSNPIVITAEDSERMAKAFRDKIYLPIFKK